MINKIAPSVAHALQGLRDNQTLLIGGFGTAGIPDELIDGLIAVVRERHVQGLTVVNNNAGNGESGLAALLKTGCVRKVICSFPRQADSYVFDGLYRSGKLELELVPQGNLSERIRAAGVGLAHFFLPQVLAPSWPRTATAHPKKPVRSMGACMSWSIPSMPTLP